VQLKKRSAKNRPARKRQQYHGQQVSAPAAQRQSSFAEKVANPNLAICKLTAL
jgi:hypothetical protein